MTGRRIVLAGASGCAFKPIEPWVKPYERERLADPVMKTSLNELPGRQQDHVYTVREGSRGATGAAIRIVAISKLASKNNTAQVP